VRVLRKCRNLTFLAFLGLLPLAVQAAEPPPLPQEVQPDAVRFAQRDAERAAQQAQALAEQAKQAAKKAADAEAALKQAQSEQAKAAEQVKQTAATQAAAEKAKAEAEQEVKTALADRKKLEAQREAATAAIEKAEKTAQAAAKRVAAEIEKQAGDEGADNETEIALLQAKLVQVDADKAVLESRLAVLNLQKQIEQAKQAHDSAVEQAAEHAKRLKNAVERMASAEKAKAAADKAAEAATKAAQPLIDAKAAAEKKAQAAEKQAEAAAQRAEQFAQSPPQADPKSIRLLETFKHNRPMMSCRFDGAGDYVFAGAQDADIHRWDIRTGEKVELSGHRSWVRRMVFHPDGKSLISGGYAGQLIRWNAADHTPTIEWAVEAHRGYVRGVAVSPDGRLIATGGNDNLVKIWSAADGALIHELAGHERNVYNVAFHPGGHDLVSGDLMGNLKHWDVSTGELLREMQASELHKYDTTFRADCGGFRGMEFSPSGKYLAAAGIGEVTNAFAGVGVPTVVLFDWSAGKRVKVMKPAENFRGTCWGVRFHPSGEFLMGAGGGSAGALWFWRLDSEKSFFEFKLPQVAYDAVFHPDGLRLAVALYNQTVLLYDLGPPAAESKKK
jgi:WD40 repeat protein